MDESLASWEGEWSSSHGVEASLPTTNMRAGPTCSYCYEEEVFVPAQQLLMSQLRTQPVDQLLQDGLVAASDSHLKFEYGGVTECYPESSPPGSGSSFSNHQALWSRLEKSNLQYSQQMMAGPNYNINKRKRKRESWNLQDPDPDNSGRFKLAKSSTTTFSFQQGKPETGEEVVDGEAIQQMKEMMYRAAALRPVNLGEEVVEKPRRKNVRISCDPQTVAARQRRERISERLRVLQKLVPGGCKMDTASMLDEAANYLKFLRSQVKALEAMPQPTPTTTTTAATTTPSLSSSPSPNSHFSANQMLTTSCLNLSNCLPPCLNINEIPIPAMHYNPNSSNPPFLLQQYAKS